MNRRVKTYNSYIKESWINNTEQAGNREFSIIKVMTKSGEKISMCYTSEVKEYGVSLQDNLDFITAVSLVPTFGRELGLSEFDSKSDEIIAVIPNFMISKKPKATNYKDTADCCIDDNVVFPEDICHVHTPSDISFTVTTIDEDFKAKRNEEQLKKKEEIMAKINRLEHILDTKLKDNNVPVETEEEVKEITMQLESLKARYNRMK
jgi:hypothetical protein